jgi:ATP-binding cassette, subfamily B, bacterial
MQAGRTLRQRISQAFHLLPALRLVWQSSPRWAVARGLVLSLQGVLPLLSLFLLKLIIDQIAVGISAVDKAAAFEYALFLLILSGCVLLLTSLVTSLADLVNAAQSYRVTDYVQELLFEKSANIDLAYYENSQYHDTLQRAQQEAPFRPNQILNRIAQVLQNGISLTGILALLLSLYWGLAGLLLIAALPALWVRLRFAKVQYHWQRKRTSLERRSMYLGALLAHDQFAKELRLFNLGDLFRRQGHEIRLQLHRENFRLMTRRAIANLSAEGFAKVLTVAVFVFIAYETIQGRLKIGDLVLYQQALQRGESALQGVLSGLSGLYEDNLFLTNLYEFLNLKPKIVDPPYPKQFPIPVQRGIEVKDIAFQYGDTPRQAINGVSFKIQPGETIALVGENGCGKTTLVKLLCRLYEPTQGQILIDGIDISDFAISDLRQEISVIFQDYAKYFFSARENIWLGNIQSNNDLDVEEAARRSGAHAVIERLPEGYDTILGKLFERGEELSIGQWQKIALARAFLRNSQLIILDEPTSAMDPKAEYEVFQQFRELTRDQMAVLISHRLSTVRMADRIYLMDNGRIAEAGTHEELVQLNGSYARLFESQAESYR